MVYVVWIITSGGLSKWGLAIDRGGIGPEGGRREEMKNPDFRCIVEKAGPI